MTLKQLEKEIKRATKDKAEWEKRKDEAIKEGSPAHLIAYEEKWISHYDALLMKYEEQLPAAIAKEAEKEAKRAAKQEAKKQADGIVIEESTNCYIYGKTPTGKKFWANANNGLTTRARHCWCLKIDGETLFTSGTLTTVLETIAAN